MRQAWELGRLWVEGLLTRGMLPGAPLEDAELFRRAGLTSPFWSR